MIIVALLSTDRRMAETRRSVAGKASPPLERKG
jgi:hypothetical protein